VFVQGNVRSADDGSPKEVLPDMTQFEVAH
jgi:hypothetical protein